MINVIALSGVADGSAFESLREPLVADLGEGAPLVIDLSDLIVAA